MDFATLSRAGVTQAQFGALIGVDRVTVNTWARGRFSPRADLRPKVVRALQLLAAAVENGDLPVDHAAAKERLVSARLKKIATALRKPG